MCIRINKIIIIIGLLFSFNSYSYDLCPFSPIDLKYKLPKKERKQLLSYTSKWNDCFGKLRIDYGEEKGFVFIASEWFGGKMKGLGIWYVFQKKGGSKPIEDFGDVIIGQWTYNAIEGGKGILFKKKKNKIYVGNWDNLLKTEKYEIINGVIKGIHEGLETGQLKEYNFDSYEGELYPDYNSVTLEDLERILFAKNKETDNELDSEDKSDNTDIGIEEAKASCKDIGFKKGTEKFGECVLELTK